MNVFRKIDSRKYGAYKELRGRVFRAGEVEVSLTHIQSDPFAPPSVARVRLPLRMTPRYPIPVADLIHRKLFFSLSERLRRSKRVGEGKSGVIGVPKPSHWVIPRSTVVVEGSHVTVRLWVGLPSLRRRILGDVAEELLLEELPKIVTNVINSLGKDDVKRVEELWEDQEFLRKFLENKGYISFVADGSVLPRLCGGCEDPLKNAIPFEAPKKYAIEVELPNRGVVRGMALRGLSLITGPAFHGKSTLLEAIYTGIYNRVDGDGRELVIARRNLVYLESEGGRWVSCVDLYPFLESLPMKRDIECFSTSSASGATSIASSIQEAVEGGAEAIALDEDTVATNFIRRDFLAEELTGKRTVIPLEDVARDLVSKGISVIVITGGSMPLVKESDRIVVLDEYRVRDGERLKPVSEKMLEDAGYRSASRGYRYSSRRISKARKAERWKLKGKRLYIDGVEVDLSKNRQLLECSQMNAAVSLAKRLYREGTTSKNVKEVVEKLWNWEYPKEPPPNFAYIRPVDVWLLLNKIPGTHFTKY